MPRLEKWDADMIVISGPYAIRTLDIYDVQTSCEYVSELALKICMIHMIIIK